MLMPAPWKCYLTNHSAPIFLKISQTRARRHLGQFSIEFLPELIAKRPRSITMLFK